MKVTRNENFDFVEFSEQELAKLGDAINSMHKIGENREGKGVYIVSKKAFTTLLVKYGFDATFTPNTSKTKENTAKEDTIR